jgi:MbtH protein
MSENFGSEDEHDELMYKVVINHEEQYSIWPGTRDNPLGWSAVGKSGTKQECLEYIDEVWTDITPLSVRRALQERREEAG